MIRICALEGCDNHITKRRNIYCCMEHSGLASRNKCKRCGKPSRLNCLYCSPECARPLLPPRKCLQCGKEVPRITGRLTCSDECYRAQGAATHRKYPDELIQQIRELRERGVYMKDVAEQLSLSFGAVNGICERNKIFGIPTGGPPRKQREHSHCVHCGGPMPAHARVNQVTCSRNCARSLPDKAPRQPRQYVYKPKQYAPSIVKEAPAQRTDDRIKLPLHLIYNRGFQLYWDREADKPSGLLKFHEREDVDAINRVTRKLDPTHPGYVVASKHDYATIVWSNSK